MTKQKQKFDFQQMTIEQLDDALIDSCRYGHLEEVKYLLTSPDLKQHANIHANNDYALRFACYNGHLEIVRYLLTSPDLKEHANIHAQNDGSLRFASLNGHLEIVRYLLTSPDLKEHAHIHAGNGNTLIWACQKGRLEVVKYLLTSPELTEHANIHVDNDSPFINALGYMEIVIFLIFDYRIEKTKDIEQYLADNKREDIIMMFNKREFTKKLQIYLIKHDKNNINIKI